MLRKPQVKIVVGGLWALSVLVVAAAARAETSCAANDFYTNNDHWPCGGSRSANGQSRSIDCRWARGPEAIKWIDWSRASGVQSCARNETCDLEFAIDSSRELIEHFPISLSMRAEDARRQTGALGELGKGKALAVQAHREQLFRCQVEPGYRVEVWLGAEMRTLKGTMQALTRQWDSSSNSTRAPNSTSCCEFEGDMFVPVVDLTADGGGGQLSGPLECRQKRVPDVGETYFYRNQLDLRPGCELYAVEDVLRKLGQLEAPARPEQSLMTAAVRCGHKVYARAFCLGLGELADSAQDHQAKCGACLGHLRQNILARGERSRGAKWRVTHCYLQYEFEYFKKSPRDVR